MVQIIQKKGSLASQLGSGFGKGLSETLGKEFESARKARGIKELAETAKAGGDPLEFISKAVGIPGLDTAELQAVMPFIMKTLERSQRLNISKGAGGGQETERERIAPLSGSEAFGAGQPQQQQQQQQQGGQLQQQPQQQGGSKIPEERDQFIQYQPIQEGTRAFDNRVDSLLRNNPNLSVEGAEKRAQDEITRFKNLESETTTLFQTALESKLQKEKSDTYSDVTGETQKKFLLNALGDVASGKMTPRQAADEASQDLLNFAKTKQKVKTYGGFWSRLAEGFNPSANRGEVKRILKSARDEFAKIGELDEFKDLLITRHGMTEPFANLFTYPAAAREPLRQLLSKEVSKPKKERKSAEEIVKKIIPTLRPTDSLMSIALLLDAEGYNSQEVLEAFKRESNQGITELNSRQKRELLEKFRGYASAGDVFTLALTGHRLSDAEKVPLSQGRGNIFKEIIKGVSR